MKITWRILLLAGCMLGSSVGCSASTPAPPTSADLTSRLGRLRDDPTNFTASQVRCVAVSAHASLTDGDLEKFDQELEDFQLDGSTTGMSPANLKVLTDAIAKCAVPGG